MAASRSQARLSGCIAAVLTDVCAANTPWAVNHDPDDLLSSFECSRPPAISVANYMRKLEQVGGAEYWPQCLILIDELSRATRVPVSGKNVHRLVITAYSLVLKLCIDGTGTTPLVAQAGGVAADDLVEMENAFLLLLDFRVAVGAAAHEQLVAGCPLVQETARHARANSRDGPITLIPGAVVPLNARFTLEVAGAAAPQQLKQESRCPGVSPGVPEASQGLAPCPPKRPSSSASACRPQVGALSRPASAPTVVQGEEAACPAARKRIASALAFAQANESA